MPNGARAIERGREEKILIPRASRASKWFALWYHLNTMAAKKQYPAQEKYIQKNFRYRDEEHLALVKEAAALAGLSVNAWIVNVTLQMARKQLAKGPATS